VDARNKVREAPNKVLEVPNKSLEARNKAVEAYKVVVKDHNGAAEALLASLSDSHTSDEDLDPH
jgi:hypothetical protein